MPEHVERVAIERTVETPAPGQRRASWELRRKGVAVSSGVRLLWLRNDPETTKKRMAAPEARAAQDGLLPTEEQMATPEKAKRHKEAHGEVESHRPGYLGSQDTCDAGTMKGAGRIYRRTFVTCARAAIAAPNLSSPVERPVVPFFAGNGIRLPRIPTGAPNGKVENHACRLYLAVEDVDRSKTSPSARSSTGQWRRCRPISDVWLAKYNAQRPHSGRYCYGKTPVQTFRETLHIAVDKTVSASEPADSGHPILGNAS